MMKNYERAMFTVTEFSMEDIITTSGDIPSQTRSSVQVRNGNSVVYDSNDGTNDGTNDDNWMPWLF